MPRKRSVLPSNDGLGAVALTMMTSSLIGADMSSGRLSQPIRDGTWRAAEARVRETARGWATMVCGMVRGPGTCSAAGGVAPATDALARLLADAPSGLVSRAGNRNMAAWLSFFVRVSLDACPRPGRLHALYRQHRTRRDDARLAAVPRRDGQTRFRARGHSGPLRRRWADDLLQRPASVSRPSRAGGAHGCSDARPDG